MVISGTASKDGELIDMITKNDILRIYDVLVAEIKKFDENRAASRGLDLHDPDLYKLLREILKSDRYKTDF